MEKEERLEERAQCGTQSHAMPQNDREWLTRLTGGVRDHPGLVAAGDRVILLGMLSSVKHWLHPRFSWILHTSPI